MNQFKISTRLAGLLAALCLLVLLVGVAGLYGMGNSNAGLKSVYDDRVVPLKQIKVVADMYAVNVVDTAHKVRDGTLTPAQGLQSVADARKAIEANWKAYLATQLVPEETQLVERFKPLQAKADAATDVLAGHFKSGDVAALTAFAAKEMYPAIDPLQEVLGQLMQVQLDRAKAEYDSAAASYQTIRALAVTAVVAGIVLAVLMGGAMIRQISRALGDAVQITDAVAQGDLTVAIHARGKDEIAQLLSGLTAMRDNLAHVVSGVRGNAQGVASASAEIASGNNDLSIRTEQQASALQETAASMEELSSTVKQNADNARQANQLAMSASTVAGQGGDVVAEVVTTMKGINDSSKKIADIISVIDGIAFQTNILALNAAVEAARAGEQGRGFAVVAGEVRNLAQRSAEAAKEIKSLITASVERVEQGTQLVDKAGITMTEVVGAIRRVTDIMGEISAASSEQSTGVSQVGEAVMQMDQVTQQNAALVEEMAAAASSLSHQAQALVGAVAVFKLTADQARASQPGGAVDSVPRPAPAADTRKAAMGSHAAGSKATLALRSPSAPAAKKAPAASATTKAAGAASKAAPQAVAAGAEDDWESF
ncbi:methyl-accepting chemotaxis protein/methyl-accepting chemotaxis protein-1 (serine sensor receptor) [Acidovorax sp. 99]|uniref:methyl-accepting chemotaxis protein n=1 Tax=Acidovorax sp. 99 TaxID=2135634 RepID=UPI000D5E015E|nr:methyl-accepting chemotaxis protein [Acidovorax sp. 99]PVY92870.1 methyl-accepting chemotaxis protein/methyl-accepting chemotaxis protein-1 (serine sensor receptor) [Acidovorax sp. 99]